MWRSKTDFIDACGADGEGFVEAGAVVCEVLALEDSLFVTQRQVCALKKFACMRVGGESEECAEKG